MLLGDAAHTAHFSIGSGTKLALEDAIELAGALGRHDAVRAALVEYELERRPVVERFQEAARQSAEYFEEVPRHWALHPLQFAFNLLTRSGRIGHANLTLRDPALVRARRRVRGGRRHGRWRRRRRSRRCGSAASSCATAAVVRGLRARDDLRAPGS